MTRARKQLEGVEAKIIGGILNGVKVRRFSHYYSDYYYHGYSRYYSDYHSAYYTRTEDRKRDKSEQSTRV